MSMNVNPYEAPKARIEVVGVRSGRREDLRSIAISQKRILACFLLYIGVGIGDLLLPVEWQPYLGLGVILLGLVATVFVVLFAIKVYSNALGVVMGILTLLPCIGLIVLLM